MNWAARKLTVVNGGNGSKTDFRCAAIAGLGHRQLSLTVAVPKDIGKAETSQSQTRLYLLSTDFKKD
jgi:hypothetical protein